MLTLSGLQLAATCVGAAVLPRIGNTSKAADMGSALHEYNALLGERGRHAADEAADAIAARWGLDGRDYWVFFGRARKFLPDIPEGALYEVPLCMRADGTVEPVVGGRGEYAAPDDAIVAGTLDITFAMVGSEAVPLAPGDCPPRAILWTPDLKTGRDANVPPIDRNWQARVSALLGARYYGANFVVPAILFLGSADGGTWDVPKDANGLPRPLRAAELDQIEIDVRTLAERVAEGKRRYLAGGLPKLTTGAHCTYCPARVWCPAHVAEARAIVTGVASLAAEPLTHEQAVKLAGLLGPANAALENAKEALRAYVETNGPIVLPDGREYGPEPSTSLVLDARKTYAAIRAEIDPLVGEEEGSRYADFALETSRDGVYEAIRAAHVHAGIKRKMKAAYESIMGALRVSGGVTEVQKERWAVRYPKAALTEKESE